MRRDSTALRPGVTMTTGTRPEPAGQMLREWAADQLDLDAAARPEEVRAQFLRRLPDEDFLPPLAWQEAAALLDGLPAPATPPEDAVAEMAESLREEVESFAGQFFALRPDERRARWQTLAERCRMDLPL